MIKLLLQRKLFLAGWLVFVSATLVFLAVYGKQQSHIMINQWNSATGDVLFSMITMLGNGLFVVALALLLSLMRLRWFLLLMLSFILSGIIVQLMKHLVFPDIARPAAYFEGIYRLHLPQGIKIYRMQSFPSGHSASAFAVFYTLTWISRKRLLEILWLLFAIITAFSRVYLSQHFLLDIVAGSFLGILSVIFAVWILEKVNKAWMNKNILNILYHG